ncbi:MAG: hypothetical protein IJH36_13365 [Clostridia bacterium]|nr:hypothetical protein [Clostridia bacterium]MBQ3464065.1 hypothetical protein [Clostridia bacterium]
MPDGKFNIPQSEIESLSRMLLPKIQAFYASEDGKAQYQRWLDEENAECNNKENPQEK